MSNIINNVVVPVVHGAVVGIVIGTIGGKVAAALLPLGPVGFVAGFGVLVASPLVSGYVSVATLPLSQRAVDHVTRAVVHHVGWLRAYAA
jgi:hypothetical protein